MLLLILACLRVLVLENEVDLFLYSVFWPMLLSDNSYLVGSATFIRSEHDHVWRGVGELLRM